MSTPATLQLALPQTATLGEGLHWHPASGRWWWTDIEARAIYAWTPGAADTLRVHLPERVGCFVHGRSGALLLGMAGRLARLQLPDLQAVGERHLQPHTLELVEDQLPTTRVNDGRCDRDGQLVFGTLDEARPRQPIGSFYQYSLTHGLRRLALDGVAIANSICFSPDGRRMHYCDTLTRRLMVCDYDAANAEVSAPRLFAQKDLADAWPDGSTMDAQGHLWNAEWGHGSVARYAPDGTLVARYTLAAPHVTCPALGGPAGDELMVTTAREEMSPEQLAAWPLAGSLFGLRLPAGLYLPEVPFAD